MKKQSKKYERPLKPYDKSRIEKEKEILTKYGLRRKKEIWKAISILRNFRRLARQLEAQRNKEKESILLGKLRKLGLIDETSTLDDVLALEVEKILDRRLQTIVLKKGLATSAKQARQFIVHGHVALDEKKIKWPSTLITPEEESKINYYPKSKVKIIPKEVEKVG